ncbi:hypothetical protein GPA25_03710 [Aromatoleum diolicum]|uniref:Porin n=1 Tax=Aromatoleum diolicum TaxID=75796 RepID=A0ABX1Q9K1_9RHOO|nr:hypothetical protein [Aromatoleum diolicum]
MNFTRTLALALGAVAYLAAALPAQAERPMVVDDAGTLDKGGAKLEFGWSRDDETRGFDAAVGYGPIENLEVELALAQARDHEPDPSVRLRAVGAALKWVPLQVESGLSAGLKLEYARERADLRDAPDETARASAVTGLATWNFASGQRVHLNLGREWVRVDGDTDDANTWGVGFEHPLTGTFTVAAEVFGVEDTAPDRQIGVRYEVVEGVKLSGAVGRGNDRSFANVGVAWEF